MMTAHPKKSLYPFSRETAGNKRPKRVADMIKNEIGVLLLSKVKTRGWQMWSLLQLK